MIENMSIPIEIKGKRRSSKIFKITHIYCLNDNAPKMMCLTKLYVDFLLMIGLVFSFSTYIR